MILTCWDQSSGRLVRFTTWQFLNTRKTRSSAATLFQFLTMFDESTAIRDCVRRIEFGFRSQFQGNRLIIQKPAWCISLRFEAPLAGEQGPLQHQGLQEQPLRCACRNQVRRLRYAALRGTVESC